MDELRWTLLGLGVLFLGGLALWELRKPRHAGRRDEADGFPAEPGTPGFATRRVEPRFDDTDDVSLPVTEVPSLRPTPDIGADPPVLVIDERRSTTATLDVAIAADVAIDEPGLGAAGPDEVPPFEEAADDDVTAGSVPATPVGAAAAPPAPAAVAPPVAARPVATPAVDRGPPEPRWPPENERRIVSLRVVPRAPTRFAGRTLRLAFEGCGLEFGGFDIFHLVDESGEVVASAANLMRPGTFQKGSMDGQYFHGVHLFCVLPGPLPPGRAVDELIALSRDLAQRLSAIVTDDVGQPLDEERAAALRASADEPG